MNIKPIELLDKCNISYSKNKKSLNMHLDMQALKKFGEIAPKEYLKHVKKEHINSKDLLSRVFSNEDASWRGGTFTGLMDNLINRTASTKHIDLARQSIKDVFADAVQKSDYTSKRRRRSFSEHDGDWELDRMWEQKPFARTIKAPTKKKCVRIDAELIASARVGPEQINDYASFIVALIEQIESRGVTTEVNLLMPNMINDHKVEVSFSVKKPGEYLTTQDFASVFSCNFMRRLGFSLYCFSQEMVGIDSPYGLGTPNPTPQAVTLTESGLRLSPINGQCPDVHQVIETVSRLLT